MIAALDLARHPGELALSLVGCAVVVGVVASIWWLTTHSKTKD